MPDNAIIWVNSSTALKELRATLARETAIAVDTEADSLYSYFDKVCLLQISTRDADYVVDPLAVDLKPLAPIFAEARVEKTFHAAEYDILCLKRDYGFEFANIFDTMIAARVLGWKNVGLGNVLQERFGVMVNKKFQRADWGRRPLSREQMAYAREDTHYLLALRDLQIIELEKRNRLLEARAEFERLTRAVPTPRRFDPDAYWNLDGARDLEPARLGILRELFRWRDAQARKENHPPFKVLSEVTLINLAVARPTSPRALQNVGGVSPYIFRRYGNAILDAVHRGLAQPQTQIPQPRGRGAAPLDDRARTRLGKLKEWRKERAAARGVATDVIVSNEILFELARRNPKTLDVLRETGLGEWKIQEYGEEIVAALMGRKK
jgi:ribonuclease D